MQDSNYIQIQGWMINKLGLSDNKLLMFAIIYGFSQDGESKCKASLSYFEKALGKTRKTVISARNSLLQYNLITKHQNKLTDSSEYTVNYDLLASIKTTPPNLIASGKITLPLVEKLHYPSGKTTLVASGEITPNNNIYNNTNNNSNKNSSRAKPNADFYKNVIDYLNEILGTSYKYTSKATQRLINARVNEGFTLKEFKAVIDNKHNDWHKSEKMKPYLRPQTLFGTKFEAYLNESKDTQKSDYEGMKFTT